MFDGMFDSPWKIAIYAIVILVVFGSRKLPDAARSLGKSMRILRTEIRSLNEDDEPAATEAATVQSAPAQLQAQAVPAVPDSQAQIDALSKQLADLQQTMAANKTDNAQAS